MPKTASEPPNFLDRKRLLWLSLILFVFFAVLIYQFYKIQMIEGEKWSKVADRQHYFAINEPFMRGTFFSNTSIKKDHLGPPLGFVTDVQKFHLFVDPESVPVRHRSPIAEQLALILEVEQDEKEKLRNQFNLKSRSRKLAAWLDAKDRDSILEWWYPYARKYKIPRNTLFFVNDYQRSYPYGKLLGQVLHTIQNTKEAATSQAIPTGGLELYFNSYLKGKLGKRRMMRSPRNSLETGEMLTSPQNGASIYLTINHCLQAIAEEELEKGVKKVKAKSGWAVMMDPYSGEIWALAQYPFFLPPDYQRYFNTSTLIEHTKVKALTDAHEPGSIMKPITLAIALQANEELKRRNAPPIFDPHEKMATSNPYFPGRKKPLKDTHLHYYLNMSMAIQKSSNIYVARLVEKIINKLGNEWYRSALNENFGFGQKTGIELPSESSGLLPRPGKKHPNGALEWSAATPYSLAMGHNIQCNSLQILRAYAAFANGGYLVQPTLVRKITKTDINGDEQILKDNTTPDRKKQFRRIMTPEIAKTVLQTMKFSTKPGGTARRADIWGYSEGGKTGTADKAVHGVYSPEHVCSSFIGIAPINNPTFVLIVAIDEPEYGYEPGLGKKHHGGFCAAPVFREISKRSLTYLGIAPDDPHGYPTGDPRYDPKKADWMPEILQLQEIYEKWNIPPKR